MPTNFSWVDGLRLNALAKLVLTKFNYQVMTERLMDQTTLDYTLFFKGKKIVHFVVKPIQHSPVKFSQGSMRSLERINDPIILLAIDLETESSKFSWVRDSEGNLKEWGENLNRDLKPLTDHAIKEIEKKIIGK